MQNDECCWSKSTGKLHDQNDIRLPRIFHKPGDDEEAVDQNQDDDNQIVIVVLFLLEEIRDIFS